MPSHIAPRPFPDCFDTYLRYAVQTKFDYFVVYGKPPPSVVLLVRLRPDATIEKFRRKFLPRFPELVIGPTKFDDGRIQKKQDFLTVRCPQEMVTLEAWDDWEDLAWWVTLSMPIAPTGVATPQRIDPRRARSESKTVIAVIDDGCPFASERVRANTANTDSRVFAIWDQNRRPPVQVGGRQFGRTLIDFAYGLEFHRQSTPAQDQPMPVIGIDEWVSMHMTPAGQVDEQWCYSHAEFESLRASRSHGAHVLDILAGALPPSSGLSFNPRKPPTFKRATDKASKSDIVFVQIPREAVDDPTGGWLDVQVTDALYFIMSCIDPKKTKRVVVNLSYGPTTRPHDGMSNLEYVMSCFTAYFNGTNNRPKLHIVVSAGNSRLSEWHVAFRSTRTKRSATWVWRVPPDNPVPVFAEIWVPKGKEQYVSGTLLAPVPNAPYRGQTPFIARAEAPVSNSYGWLIVLPPTAQNKAAPTPAPPSSTAPPGQWSFASVPPPAPPPPPASLKNLPPGPHGDWQIQLTFSASKVEAHAYIARSDPNMGARVASKPTRFVDTNWEVQYGARASYRVTDGVRDISGSLIKRKGTLSGVATLMTSGFRVAGGYRLRDGLPSRYSSRGPSRDARPGPDYALPSDESLNLLGMRAGGNRNGVAFRLIGTSTAAPQLARHIVNQAVLAPTGGGPVSAVGNGKLRPP